MKGHLNMSLASEEGALYEYQEHKSSLSAYMSDPTTASLPAKYKEVCEVKLNIHYSFMLCIVRT